jgi:hypothetical protein
LHLPFFYELPRDENRRQQRDQMDGTRIGKNHTKQHLPMLGLPQKKKRNLIL